MQILNLSEVASQELLEGATVRFVHADTMTVAYWTFEAGVPLPEHAHPHEQVTNVIEGVFDLTVREETRRLEAGSVAVIPPNVTHAGRAVTACRIIDVFHPVREDYR
ncbi:MAG: cupin domain-containing protein [Anaerolineae bacterium]|nr:cupin domain-containing protein [Anaerolineae bacterium]